MGEWFLNLGLQPGNLDAYLIRIALLWFTLAMDVCLIGVVWILTAVKR